MSKSALRPLKRITKKVKRDIFKELFNLFSCFFRMRALEIRRRRRRVQFKWLQIWLEFNIIFSDSVRCAFFRHLIARCVVDSARSRRTRNVFKKYHTFESRRHQSFTLVSIFLFCFSVEFSWSRERCRAKNISELKVKKLFLSAKSRISSQTNAIQVKIICYSV